MNLRQREVFVEKILEHFTDDRKDSGGKTLGGRRIAVWGLAFKRGTDDVREAPSITIIRRLLELGATVTAHDPVAESAATRLLGDSVTYAKDPMATLQDADALVVCTDWDEYQQPDLARMRDAMRDPVVFDGRNLYRPDAMLQAGIVYHSVGRATVGSD